MIGYCFIVELVAIPTDELQICTDYISKRTCFSQVHEVTKGNGASAVVVGSA
jgi:hypothetical protein